VPRHQTDHGLVAVQYPLRPRQDRGAERNSEQHRDANDDSNNTVVPQRAR